MGSEARKLFGVFCTIHQALTDITPLYGVPIPCDRDHSTQGRSKKKHQEACREQERINSTMTISVTALAQAAAARQLQPQYLAGQGFWFWGTFMGLPPLSFVDDTTAAKMATLLGGQVIKLTAREVWPYGNPNGPMQPNVPLENFIAWDNQTGAPQPNSLLVINAGDLADTCTQGFTFGLPLEEALEQSLFYLIPGSTMSQQAQNDWGNSPVSARPVKQPCWYTPTT
jgi:hypothetical protein